MWALDPPSIEDYATIEAYVGEDEVPVYAFGYTYVYGLGPDLFPGVMMQGGNDDPVRKVKPKKSWEIEFSYCGSTPAREPKTMWNDDQPLLPIHLIDGDYETAWSSRGMLAADVRPEWIRIDLPAESLIASVALVCSKKGPFAKPGLRLGKSLPRHLTVKVSRDGKDWDTVYDNPKFSGDESGTNAIGFEPRRAKMVWVIGKNFDEKSVGFWGPGFSLGQLEVHDTQGSNLALIQRGAGVQVSTTHYGYGMDRFTQDMLWPIQYDLGFKWTRVGYGMGTFLWSNVECEKGVLQIDPRSDAAITEAHQNGVDVILCLDKGNWLYHDPPRKTDWKKSRVREMMETYYDHQGWPHESEALMGGYLRYVDYMVGHFKDRVKYFEICNEWHGIKFEDYYQIFFKFLKTIKKAHPDVRVMLGSTGGFDGDSILRCLGAPPRSGIRNGELVMQSLRVAFPNKLTATDAVVEVQARSNAEAGIVMRAKDRKNYLLAIHAPNFRGIYFHEVVDGQWGAAQGHVTVDDLGPEISLRAEIQGGEVTFTLKSADREFQTRHKIKNYQGAGRMGLFHNMSPRQRFDDFRVMDRAGKVLFEDDFNRSDGAPDGWEMADKEEFVPAEKLASLVDAVGWHPFYQADPDSAGHRNYRQTVRDFKNECEELGFRGSYVASEWTWAAPYPGAPDWCTELGKAKYAAQLMTTHAALDVISLYNETFQSGRINWDVTLLRNNSFQVDPITPSQPQPIYYVLRNLSTVLDGFRGADFKVQFAGDRKFDCDTFARGDAELMFAAWIPGRTKDGIVEARTDITLPDRRIGAVRVFDIMNGTEQALKLSAQGNGTMLPGMLIKDYPVFVRFSSQ